MRPLSWIQSASKDPTDVLATLRAKCRHLLVERKALMPYTADWRTRCGLSTDLLPQKSEEADRADFEAYVGFDPLQSGIGLDGLSWHSKGIEICWAVARWAERALLHILDLEADLTTERGAAARLAEQLLAAERRVAEVEAQAASALRLHASIQEAAQLQEARLSREVKALEAALAEAAQAHRLMSVELAASQSRERAWELSATAAIRSLEILRVAAHVHLDGEPGAALARSRG
jgi:hypothetical protein